VNIDHLQGNTSNEGPISWITSGKVDAVLDIKFPRDPHHDLLFNVLLEDIAGAISTSLSTTSNPFLERIPGQRELAKPPLSAPEQSGVGDFEEGNPRVIIDIELRFRDLKAAVPIFTTDLSYVNNALIRPIVAFMKYVLLLSLMPHSLIDYLHNSANRTLVPIHCRIVKKLNDFDGSWTVSSGFIFVNEQRVLTYSCVVIDVGE
jgi:mitochondrial distribution and morphology protein 31